MFFTALGTPDNDLSELPVRDIVPLAFRGKASTTAGAVALPVTTTAWLTV
ncbi:MAG: hypothetical protein R3F37_23490 [Candidatus Competibacteraceae bacterium]